MAAKRESGDCCLTQSKQPPGKPGRFRRFFTTPDAEVIREVCAFLRAYGTSDRRRISGRAALDGVLTQAPLFPAFYDPDPESALGPFAGIRLILCLVTLRAKRVAGQAGVAELLARRVRDPDYMLRLESAAAVTAELSRSNPDTRRLVNLLLEFASSPSQPPVDSKHFERFVRAALGESFSATADRHASSPETSWRTLTRQKVLVENIPPSEQAQLDFADSEIPPDDLNERVRWGVPNLTEDSPWVENGADEEILRCTSALETVDASREFKTWLIGPVLPGTDRVLLAAESAAVFSSLEQRFERARTVVEKAAACVTGLILLTGRHPELIAKSLLALSAGQSRRVQSIELLVDRWRCFFPLEHPTNTEIADWFETCADHIDLPYATGIQRQIRALVASTIGHDVEDILRWLPETFTDLRKHVGRASQERLRFTLASAVYIQTGHNRDWQLLTGLDGFQSTAPLHYYAPQAKNLESIYISALKQIGTTAEPIPGEPSGRVGASFAAISRQRVKSAVDLTKARGQIAYATTETRRGDVHVGINALTAYTLLWFVLLVAHRCTFRLWELNRRQFLRLDDAVLVAFADKDEAVVSTRVCALTSAFHSQLDCLLHSYAKRANELRRRGYPLHPLTQALEAAVAGDGPIFVFTDSLGNVETPSRGLAESLLPDWEIPIERARHFFATYATEYDVRACDVAQQMGHDIDSTPFSHTD